MNTLQFLTMIYLILLTTDTDTDTHTQISSVLAHDPSPTLTHFTYLGKEVNLDNGGAKLLSNFHHS